MTERVARMREKYRDTKPEICTARYRLITDFYTQNAFRACALYPENSVIWLKEELESGYISTRDIDPYIVSEEDRKYVLSTVDFWMNECMSVGHFCTGYDKAIRTGFAAIKAEAERKKAELFAQALPGKPT